MKKAMFGGSLVGAAMALTGCMSGTSAATADLAWVPESVNGRTDMFLDGNRLVTAEQLGETAAIAVDVSISDWTLIATRHGTTDVVGTWAALDVGTAGDLGLVGVTPIDGELNPGEETPINLPRGSIGFDHGTGSGTIPGGIDPGDRGLIIDWTENTSVIPGETDAREWEGLQDAHPGCA